MKFEQRLNIQAPRQQLWDFLLDVPRMATCVPGVQSVKAEGDDKYSGQMKVKVGPISVTVQGLMTIQERDQSNWRAVARAEGNDRKIGGGAHVTGFMTLKEVSPTETELVVDAVVRFMGRLGEFGEPIIRKQANTIVASFANNVAAHFQAPAPEVAAPAAPPVQAVPPPLVSPDRLATRPSGTPSARPSRQPLVGIVAGLIAAILVLHYLPLSGGRALAGLLAVIITVVLVVLGAVVERKLRPS